MNKINFFRRTSRVFFLVLFLLLLAFAGNGALWGLPADIFLRSDPLAGLLAPIARREFIISLIPAMAILACSLVAGRFFCGWICPLGTTLDAGRGLRKLWSGKGRIRDNSLYRLKYIFLICVFFAALCGINFYFWGSPISWTTRFYGLVIFPVIHTVYNYSLAVLGPILPGRWAMSLLWEINEPHFFGTAWFILLFFSVLLLLELLAPRFWCRYLCPCGALLSLQARFSPFARKVSRKCVGCGKCATACPMGIIDAKNPGKPSPECLLCGKCQTVCPANAISFSFGAANASNNPYPFSRRSFMGAAAAGLAMGGMALAEDNFIAKRPTVARAPASLPENQFLSSCLRCGECMVVCPTGALQPVWFESGITGIFSPFLDPYSGPCERECARCGHVCPTGAIMALPLSQKMWAKIGTAVIDKKTCLAWGHDRRCMVCKENCPYNAVNVITKADIPVPVPVVNEVRCYGCGYCQHACPVRPAAIIVEGKGALRLDSGNYEAVARKAGYDFIPKANGEDFDNLPPSALPPGFTE